MERTTPAGEHLAWQLLFPLDAELVNLVPFIIDWCGSTHPSETTPAGCKLSSLWLETPHLAAFEVWRALYGLEDERLHVREGPQNLLEAEIVGPSGRLKLPSW